MEVNNFSVYYSSQRGTSRLQQKHIFRLKEIRRLKVLVFCDVILRDYLEILLRGESALQGRIVLRFYSILIRKTLVDEYVPAIMLIEKISYRMILI